MKTKKGLVTIEPGMKFISKDGESRFEVWPYHYYSEDELTLCAFTETAIYPISEVDWSNYLLIVEE